MGEANQPGSNAPKKKEGKQLSQTKQIIIMAAALLVCAVLITWTVLLMRERLAANDNTTNEYSRSDLAEMTGAVTTVTTVTDPGPAEFTEASTTADTLTTSDGSAAVTSTQANATAPAVITVQPSNFSKVTGNGKTTARGGQATQGGQTTTTTTTAAHTEPVIQPTDQPAEGQIGYNKLLALYLAASQNGSAYFVDAQGSSQPTVILHGNGGYYAASPADDFSTRNRLGGTGDASEHPWQTGSGFNFMQYDAGSRFIYYASQGNNYQILGYYDTATCENVWARLHYYQLGVEWQTEYHIHYSHRTDRADGTQTELQFGTCAASGLYQVPLDFEHILDTELQNRGISIGSWATYNEMYANNAADSQALRSKAGSYNSGFTAGAGETYAVVTEGNAQLTDAGGAVLAALPAGAIVGVGTNALPLSGSVNVRAVVNGETMNGVMNSAQLLAWSAP
ncbi:MAG TPA: hypothetical protein DCP68_00595 [Ruminococcus sp.]|nr:hypothetical protein [Ruminococcus sp.]